MNIFTFLDQAATRFPENGAVFSGNTRVLGFGQLRARALALANVLCAKYSAGDRIVIATANTPEYLEIMFGIWAAGMVVTPLNAKLHPREMADVIADSNAVLAFVSPKLASGIATALDEINAENCHQIVIGTDEYATLFNSDPVENIPSDPEALAWLFYTSGTTGKSKGAMLSHRNLAATTLAHLADLDDPDANCSLIHAAPMSHGSGLFIPAYVARGARQVVPASGGFDVAEFLDICDTHPGCSAFLAPTMVQRLRLGVEGKRHIPKNLKAIIYGGGPMYVEEIRKSLAVFGPVFSQLYGQGEAPMTITGMRRTDFDGADTALLGSVGFPRSGVEVAVVDTDGKPVATCETGEVICRGDIVMQGYWNNPGATSDTLKDGWLWTGDMGAFDPRGFLTLRDRSKDVIISGGTNIYPREVEEALLKFPEVQEVCVIGQPDTEWGETVVAFVVAAPENKLDVADLDQHCVNSIARFKRPKRYIFVPELPKSNYGKVLKRELRDQLETFDSHNAANA